MALKKRGEYDYGNSQSDIRVKLLQYSTANAYEAHHFADAVCKCGGKLFRLTLDDNEGAAVRTCVACKDVHSIGDSDEFLDDAELEECACPCGHEEFEITAGVSLYEGSEDVKWLYLGCRCPKCGLTAAYGDWKNEFIGYQKLLARIECRMLSLPAVQNYRQRPATGKLSSLTSRAFISKVGFYVSFTNFKHACRHTNKFGCIRLVVTLLGLLVLALVPPLELLGVDHESNNASGSSHR